MKSSIPIAIMLEFIQTWRHLSFTAKSKEKSHLKKVETNLIRIKIITIIILVVFLIKK